MSTLAVARKELRLHRFAALAIFGVAGLMLLGGAALVPRTWTAEAVLGIDAETEVGPGVLADRLARRLEAGTGVHTRRDGGEMRVRLAAGSPQVALEDLNLLLARVVQEELGALRAQMRVDERTLSAQAEEAQARLAEAELKLGSAQRELPAGGESALGARIGQLQGERDALELDLRASNGLRTKLDARIAELEREIEVQHARPEAEQAEAQLRVDTELQPQRNQALARLATLRDEIALKDRRRREVMALLDGAQTQATGLREDNQAMRELQRVYDDAAAMHRQLRLNLQQLRDGIEVRTTSASLPFRVVRQPAYPPRPDGLPGWAWLAGALLGAASLTAARLLGRVMVDDKIRLAESIVIDAEVPVLAVIADYRPPQAVGHVRWRVIVIALLGALLAAACLAFLAAFG